LFALIFFKNAQYLAKLQERKLTAQALSAPGTVLLEYEELA